MPISPVAYPQPPPTPMFHPLPPKPMGAQQLPLTNLLLDTHTSFLSHIWEVSPDTIALAWRCWTSSILTDKACNDDIDQDAISVQPASNPSPDARNASVSHEPFKDIPLYDDIHKKHFLKRQHCIRLENFSWRIWFERLKKSNQPDLEIKYKRLFDDDMKQYTNHSSVSTPRVKANSPMAASPIHHHLHQRRYSEPELPSRVWSDTRSWALDCMTEERVIPPRVHLPLCKKSAQDNSPMRQEASKTLAIKTSDTVLPLLPPVVQYEVPCKLNSPKVDEVSDSAIGSDSSSIHSNHSKELLHHDYEERMRDKHYVNQPLLDLPPAPTRHPPVTSKAGPPPKDEQTRDVVTTSQLDTRKPNVTSLFSTSVPSPLGIRGHQQSSSLPQPLNPKEKKIKANLSKTYVAGAVVRPSILSEIFGNLNSQQRRFLRASSKSQSPDCVKNKDSYFSGKHSNESSYQDHPSVNVDENSDTGGNDTDDLPNFDGSEDEFESKDDVLTKGQKYLLQDAIKSSVRIKPHTHKTHRKSQSTQSLTSGQSAHNSKQQKLTSNKEFNSKNSSPDWDTLSVASAW